jgi:hypothetical protein
MNGFMVNLKNQPGELARVAEAIAHKGINITGFTGAACGDMGTVAIVTNDEAGTRRALADAGFSVREIELVSASIEDKPGTLAATARRLADAGVNVEAAMPTGMSGGKVTLAFATNDPAKARSALGASVGAGAGA